jgi:hypothetical protein
MSGPVSFHEDPMQEGLDTEPNQPVIAGRSPVWERPSGWLRVRLVSCRSKLIMRSGSDDAEALPIRVYAVKGAGLLSTKILAEILKLGAARDLGERL